MTSSTVEPDCYTPSSRREFRPVRCTAALIKIAGSCDLCYPDAGPEPGDLVVRASLGDLRRPASQDYEPRNVVSAAGGEA